MKSIAVGLLVLMSSNILMADTGAEKMFTRKQLEQATSACALVMVKSFSQEICGQDLVSVFISEIQTQIDNQGTRTFSFDGRVGYGLFGYTDVATVIDQMDGASGLSVSILGQSLDNTPVCESFHGLPNTGMRLSGGIPLQSYSYPASAAVVGYDALGNVDDEAEQVPVSAIKITSVAASSSDPLINVNTNKTTQLTLDTEGYGNCLSQALQ